MKSYIVKANIVYDVIVDHEKFDKINKILGSKTTLENLQNIIDLHLNHIIDLNDPLYYLTNCGYVRDMGIKLREEKTTVDFISEITDKI